ncbi:MAG: hypothetical protein V2A34_05380 [Lentisphaerota bacterium]
MNDISRRVVSTANRLRLTQSSLADEKAETRQAYLNDLIEKELVGLAGEERAQFLRELDEQFPGFPATHRPEKVQAVPETPRPLTANELVAQFLSHGADVQQAMLAQMGVAQSRSATEKSSLPADLEPAAQGLMKKLGIKELDLARVCELSGMLTSFMGAIEQMSWNTWQTVAPSSSLKRSADLAGEIRKFLGGDAQVSPELLKQELDKLRKLLAALSASLGHLTHHLAHEHFARIAPEEIQNLVGVEGGGLLTSREVKCWRKYLELAETFNEARLETEIKASIAKYVESLVKVTGR